MLFTERLGEQSRRCYYLSNTIRTPTVAPRLGWGRGGGILGSVISSWWSGFHFWCWRYKLVRGFQEERGADVNLRFSLLSFSLRCSFYRGGQEWKFNHAKLHRHKFQKVRRVVRDARVKNSVRMRNFVQIKSANLSGTCPRAAAQRCLKRANRRKRLLRSKVFHNGFTCKCSMKEISFKTQFEEKEKLYFNRDKWWL